MKCINHNKKDAVGYCGKCGAGLCKDCFNKYSNHLCDNCAKENNNEIKEEATANLVLTIILSVAFAILGGIELSSSGDLSIIGIYVFAGIPWGWKALNRITPNIFLFMPLIGWIIYFVAKLLLSMAVGIVAMPIKIFMAIRDYSNSKKLD